MMIMQLLAGAKLIDVDMSSQEDRNLFQSTQKLFSIIITVGEALAYLLSGMYGPVNEIGTLNGALIVFQLSLSGIIVILLDELLQKSFSPITIRTEQGAEFEGAIIALFHFLCTKQNKIYALQQAFYR